MNATDFLVWLLGAGLGLGLWLVIVGLRGVEAHTSTSGRVSPLTREQLRRWVMALAAGALVLLVTRWIAAAAGIVVLVLYWDTVFGGTRRARLATARLEALATWTESLRDLVATGIALPEALPASIGSSSPLLRPQLLRLQDRLDAREPLEGALRGLGDDLADGGADLVVAALLLNTRAQGRALEAVLSALAASLREELRVRRTIEAERRSTRRAVQIVVTVTLVTALGLCLGNPVYVEPYRTTAGQLMLSLVTGVFAIGFAWLARLSALPVSPRLLPSTGGRGSVAGQVDRR
jgi:Flp pilus assembly protein TadB